MKLIKITDDHYVIVDENSEIKEGDWIYNAEREPSILKCVGKGSLRGWQEITHSTQPLDIKITDEGVHLPDWSKVKALSPRVVKELIGEVDVEKKAINSWEGCDGCDANDELFFINGYQKGYNQALEDSKDRKYTEEDMIEFAEWIVKESLSKNKEGWTLPKIFNRRGTTKELFQIWKEQQLKTIWDLEFDSQGKLKLI